MMRARTVPLLIACVLLLARPLGLRAEDAPARVTFGDVVVRSSGQATEISIDVPPGIREQDRTERRPGLSAAGSPTSEAAAQSAANPPEPTPMPEEGALGEATPTAATPSVEAPTEGMEATERGRTERSGPPPEVRPGALTVTEIRLFFPGAALDRSRMITVDDRIVQEARLYPEDGGVSMTVVVRRPVYYVVVRDQGRLRVRVEPGTLLLAESSGEIPKTGTDVLKGARRPKQRRDRTDGSSQSPFEAETLVPTVKMRPMRKGEGLTVDAEQLSADKETNEIVALGHVTIARSSSLLTADEVRINRETQRAQARGNVQFTDAQGTLSADTFTGNLEDETGDLTNGSIYLGANHLTITGEKLQKSFGQTYHIENGEFTTCRCGAGAPSWSIAGDSIDITLDGYGLVDNATLRVLDVPVLYLPKIAFPAKTQRQSGLLAPQFGYSKKRGFFYIQPAFVVLNKSADLTFAPDIESSARVGGLAELRYALDDKSKGVLDVALFNEALRNNAERDVVNKGIADPSIPEDRWSVTTNVTQELPFGIRAFADSLVVSDDLYLREIRTFSFDPLYERMLTTSRFSSSSGGLYKSWENATLIARGVYYQDFIQEDDLTLQRLPQVTFFGSQRFFDRSLKLGINSEFVEFERKKGFDGPRIDIAPNATVPFRWQEYFNGNFGLQLRETAYHLNNTELLLPVSQAGGVQATTPGPDLEKSPTRELLQGSATVGTQISRVFDVGGEDVEKIKHTIEPAVDYLYVPDVDQDDIPRYDFVDRINRRNRLTYGFTSRLLAKLEKPPPIERSNSLGTDEMNPFSGDAPSPFGDENTRGGLASLGNASLSSDPAERERLAAEGVSTEEPTLDTFAAAQTATKSTAPQDQPLTTEQLAARAAEERSAVSHVVEWARFQMFQSYDLRDSLQRRDKEDHFSDVDANLRVSPVNFFSLTFGSTVNARDTRLTSARVGMTLRDPRDRDASGFLTATQRASLSVSYRLISEGVLEQVDTRVMVPLADTLSVFYQSSYNALQEEFLAKIAGLRLKSQCQCWIADVSVADRVNPDETEIRFQITLVGLGSIGRAR